MEVELERGDDPQRRAASAQRPEQLWFVVRGSPDETAVREHDLDGADRVTLQSLLAGVPPAPAAARVADYPDIWRRRVQSHQPVLPGSVGEIAHSTPAPTRAERRSGSTASSRSPAVRSSTASPR